MQVPEGSRFCCLALDGPRLRTQGEVCVLPGLTVSSAQDAFELEPFWVEWLGTLQADSFRRSTLFITAVIDTWRPDTGGVPLPDHLDNRVRLFQHALVLLGCGFNNAVLMVGGEKHRGGGMHVGPIRSGLTPCFRPYYRKANRIDEHDLERAGRILTSLEMIYRHVPGRLYRRLRKGFNVWTRGTQEGEEWIERLHSNVRAIEAVLKPTIARKRNAKTRKNMKAPAWRGVTETFMQRGQTMIGASQQNEKLLRQLYDIRSSVEHIKDIIPAVRKVRGIAKDEAFGFRALQAELLASDIYARILDDAELLKAFSTDVGVEAFWRRNAVDRRKLWGDAIDLETLAREQFFSYSPEELY